MPRFQGLVIDSNGYFCSGGTRIVPIGVNYWPASCGVEMWQRWPEDEIQHDLDLIVSLGLDAIRFFLRWQDFEPLASRYDPTMFKRLAQLLSWCKQRDLYAQPSLFVGWMSGGVFWPAWKGDQNLFSDPFMVERAAAFARQATAVIAPFHTHLLGIDQGNELCCLADSGQAAPQDVIQWCKTVNTVIHDIYPHSLIVSGNDQNQILNDTGWRFNQQPGTHYYSMHGYPVPGWHTVDFDGMTDPLCQSLLPFYTQVARAFGPVMVQEFGTIVTFGEQQQDRYLRALLPACWEAGANGFLWWCLRDVTADVHPYLKHRFESTLGLVDANDRVKPGLQYLIEFARTLPERPLPKTAADAIGLYLPKHFYPRENPQNPGNDPQQVSRWLVMANFMLRQLGHTTRVVRGDQPIPESVHTLVLPGVLLDAFEVRKIEAWVRAGNTLLWHGPDPVNWGHEYIRLLGAQPVDYRAPPPATIDVWGSTWVFETYPRNMRVEIVPQEATVIARDQRGLPVVLKNSVGQGTVTYALPIVEESIARVSDDRERRNRWQTWYREMLDI